MVEKIQNLEDLKTAVQSISVKDYGDFKRKIVLYINRYKETRQLSTQDQKIFIEMIEKIQFHPSLDIESTRNWTMDKLNQLSH
jgi:hypothetical protein